MSRIGKKPIAIPKGVTIKADATMKSIPVIVLTASPREEDVVRTYNLGVNTYIQKPVEFDNFMRVVHAVQEYWIVIASLPPTV